MNTGHALSCIHDIRTHYSSVRMSPGSRFDRLIPRVDDRLYFTYISNKCIGERRGDGGTATWVCCDTDSSALYFSYLFQLGFPSSEVIPAVANPTPPVAQNTAWLRSHDVTISHVAQRAVTTQLVWCTV